MFFMVSQLGDYLSCPDVVQVLHCQSLLFNDKAKDLLQFLDILWLMQTVSQHNRQDVILLDPLLIRMKPKENFRYKEIHSKLTMKLLHLTHRHAFSSEPFFLFRVMSMSVVGHTRDYFINFI